MKTLTFYALALFAGALLLVGCGGGKDDHKGKDHGAEVPAGGEKIAQQTCPVMEGNKINPKLFTEYKGRRIYFCCPGCDATFKKDPEKYVKKVDAELAKLKAGGTAPGTKGPIEK